MTRFKHPTELQRILASLIAFALAANVRATEPQEAGVVVYGATPAGVAAAVNAAREGASVWLVEETHHIGGMTAGGASHTDFKTWEALGGAWREFMRGVVRHYTETYGADSPQARACARGGYYEPRVARRVFEQMLTEAQVRVLTNRQLARVQKDGSRIVSLAVRPSDSSKGYPLPAPGEPLAVRGRIFIDATYEGDLMAAAGVPCRVGVEGRAEYGEESAPEQGNRHVQCYNFRITLTKTPANRLPLPPPADYDRSRYALLIDEVKAGRIRQFDDIIRGPVRPLPNDKADFNDRMGAPVSLRISGETDAWPEGSPEVRARIFQYGKNHALSIFHFILNDEEFGALAPHIRDELRPWGLCKDEYPETGHWPPVIYVREARRMLGQYVFTERDVLAVPGKTRAPMHADAIAIGDYGIDAHGTHEVAPGKPAGVLHPGPRTRPFNVPYGVIVPREAPNLLVPVAVSASHVGFQPIRMEPCWTGLGQAAGVAAAQALRRAVSVQEVDVQSLQRRLHELGAMTVYLSDVPPGSPHFRAAQFLGTHGFFQSVNDTASASGFFDGPPPEVPSQWRKQPYAGHAVKPGSPLDAALAETWRRRFEKSFPGTPLPPDALTSNGTLTRGEAIAHLFAATNHATSNKPSGVRETHHHAAVGPRARAADYRPDSAISADAVGETIDVVKLGAWHWSRASGDPNPDILDGIQDLDDSFGQHAGKLQDPKSFDLRESEATMVVRAPEGGRYALCVRVRTGKDRLGIVEYMRGHQWVKLPRITGDPKWRQSWQDKVFCYVIETAPNQTEIPLRISAIQGAMPLQGVALARLRAGTDSQDAQGTQHPRMLFTVWEVPQVRKRLKENPFLAERIGTVHNPGFAKVALARGSYDKLTDDKATALQSHLLPAAVLGVILEDDSLVTLATQYVEKAIEQQDWGTTLRQAGMINTVAIAYDCLYDQLGSELRQRVRNRLELETNALYLEAILGAWWGTEMRANNWQAVCNSAIGVSGLAMLGESPLAPQYIDWARRLCQVYLKTTLAADGSCREAYSSYFNYAVGNVVNFFVCLKNATGEDLLDYDTKVLQRTVAYSLYMMHPMRDGFLPFDDTEFGYHMNGVAVMAAMVRYRQDRLAQWLVMHYGGEKSGRDRFPGWRPWEETYTLIWYDPKLPPESPDTSPRMPLAKAYIEDGEPGTGRWSSGHVFMRTGFESKDDIALMMQCGDAGGFHGHSDQGSFVLDAYGGHLVGDVGKFGGYGGVGNNWAHGPTSHSVVLVDGKGQVANHMDGSGRLTRDGTVDAFLHSGFADYALANTTVAYLSGENHVKYAYRHFLFVRKPQRRGYFVIVDDVFKDDGESHEYSSLLHSTQYHKPVTNAEGGQFSFLPSQDKYGGENPQAYSEGAEASLQVLFAMPEKPKMEIISSEKMRGWNNGVAYPDGAPVFFPPCIKTSYRAKRGLFVSLLYPESNRLKITMSSIQRVAEANSTGFVIGQDIVLFRQDGNTLQRDDIVTDGEMLLAAGKGQARSFLVAKATHLTVGGEEIFEASVPVSIALDARGAGAVDGPVAAYELTRQAGGKKTREKYQGRSELRPM